MTAVTRAADGTVTGNTYDKYGTRNPIARALQGGFERNLDDPLIAAEWERRGAPNLTYIAQRAERLPFTDGEFDLVTAIEVLEHVPDPAHTVAEMARCAQGHVLVSVPREPLWRAVNMARGAYWQTLGNTPGHVNHFSKAAIVELCSRHGEVIETRSPFPWTMVLVRV